MKLAITHYMITTQVPHTMFFIIIIIESLQSIATHGVPGLVLLALCVPIVTVQPIVHIFKYFKKYHF